MSEPRRLLEEGGSDLERTLLRSARTDAPPQGSRRKTMLALGLAGGVGAALTTATGTSAAVASSGAAGGLGILKWIGVGLVAGLAVVGATTLPRMGDPERVPHAPPSRAPEAAPAPEAATAPEAAPVPVPEPAPPPSAEPAPHPSTPPAVPRPAPTSLTEETASLDTANRAFRAGDASGALRALDEHDRKFPGGALGPEATVLRIEALALRGDRATATRLGKAFLDAHPRSPHASRLRSLLGLDAPVTMGDPERVPHTPSKADPPVDPPR